jgi:hypothetical protein
MLAVNNYLEILNSQLSHSPLPATNTGPGRGATLVKN